MDITSIAKNFTDFYYREFDQDRARLAPLYVSNLISRIELEPFRVFKPLDDLQRPHSMLTWEGKQFQGGAIIVNHLTELPFQKVAHKVSTYDVQPSSLDMSTLLISVTGMLLVDDSEHPMNFSQVFVLAKDGETFYVLNDIFRLNYG